MFTPSSSNGAPSGAPFPTNEMLVQFIETELRKLDGHNGPYTTVIRASLERTVQLLRLTGARSQPELEERVEANEASVAERHFQHGFQEGRIRGIEEVQSVLRASIYSRN
jgi:hypothetical protein